jgi:hypothetical protein
METQGCCLPKGQGTTRPLFGKQPYFALYHSALYGSTHENDTGAWRIFEQIVTQATAVFVCMKRESLLGVPRAACGPCETGALADKPPVALFQVPRRGLRSTHSSENRCRWIWTARQDVEE